MFGIIWTLALVGMLQEIKPRSEARILSLVIYALMGWIVVVQLVTITLGIAATGWLLRRWGPHRMKGMARPAEAERLLGLRRLRKVATVIRPDLYAATPKGDHHDGYHPTR